MARTVVKNHGEAFGRDPFLGSDRLAGRAFARAAGHPGKENIRGIGVLFIRRGIPPVCRIYVRGLGGLPALWTGWPVSMVLPQALGIPEEVADRLVAGDLCWEDLAPEVVAAQLARAAAEEDTWKH